MCAAGTDAPSRRGYRAPGSGGSEHGDEGGGDDVDGGAERRPPAGAGDEAGAVLPHVLDAVAGQARAYEDASPTARLRFRTWTSDDLPLAVAIWGDARVTAKVAGPFDVIFQDGDKEQYSGMLDRLVELYAAANKPDASTLRPRSVMVQASRHSMAPVSSSLPRKNPQKRRGSWHSGSPSTAWSSSLVGQPPSRAHISSTRWKMGR